MYAAVLDEVRHDAGDDGVDEDEGCRNGPCTLAAVDAAKEEPVVEEVEVIVLLLSARQDDKRAERVAMHATQCAMLLGLWYTASLNQSFVALMRTANTIVGLSDG